MNRIGKGEQIFMWAITAVVTVVFYFILKHFGTANIVPSTLSVTTSFVAVYLTFRRSPFFALAYAANDVVLIVLWVLAAMTDTTYISVIVCFVVFLVNDLYGFFCWLKMQKRQNTGQRPGGEPPLAYPRTKPTLRLWFLKFTKRLVQFPQSKLFCLCRRALTGFLRD